MSVLFIECCSKDIGYNLVRDSFAILVPLVAIFELAAIIVTVRTLDEKNRHVDKVEVGIDAAAER